MLTFFLFDLGLVPAKRIDDLKKSGSLVMGFSIFMPVLNALIGIFLVRLIGMCRATLLVFTVLFANTSYIVVPVAMVMTLAKANPSLYI